MHSSNIVCVHYSSRLHLPLSWNNQTVEAEVYWFEEESDPSLNSNAYKIARHVVEKYFPGEFGSERLVQSAVDVIIKGTAKTSSSDTVKGWHPDHPASKRSGENSEPHGGLLVDTGSFVSLFNPVFLQGI